MKIILLISFLLASLTLAQENQERVNCKISMIHFGDLQGSSDFYFQTKQDGPFQKISSLTSSVPLPLDYSGPPQLTLFRKDPSTESGYKRIAQCSLKPSFQRVILLAIIGKNNTMNTLKAIESSEANFPFGSRIVINRTSADLRGVYASLPNQKKQLKKTFTVKPGGVKAVQAIDINAAALTPHFVFIEYLTKSNKDSNKWNTLCKSRWFNTPEERHLLFVYYANGILRLKGVTDGTLRPKGSSPHTVNVAAEEEAAAKLAKQHNKKQQQSLTEKYQKLQQEQKKQQQEALKKNTQPTQ